MRKFSVWRLRAGAWWKACDEARAEVKRLQAERDAARRWAKRWKAAAKRHREVTQTLWRASERAVDQVAGDLEAQLAALRAAAQRLAQKSNRVTCGPRHQHTMTPELDALYDAQLAVEAALAEGADPKEGGR